MLEDGCLGVVNYSLCSSQYKKTSNNLTVYQKSTLTSVQLRKDMFVCLPTGLENHSFSSVSTLQMKIPFVKDFLSTIFSH